MSFLLDTDTCSAYLRGNGNVYGRFLQYTGRLHVSTITVGELSAWMIRIKLPAKLQMSFADMLSEVKILDVTRDVAEKYGEVRAHQLDTGTRSPQADLWIACTSLVHDLTLVTHNTADFIDVPHLRLDDWMT